MNPKFYSWFKHNFLFTLFPEVAGEGEEPGSGSGERTKSSFSFRCSNDGAYVSQSTPATQEEEEEEEEGEQRG